MGVDFGDRKKIYRTLKRFYDEASKVVHGGSLESSRIALLTDVQDICRKGILKRLDESKKPNWDELMLGCEMENGGTRE